MNALKSVIKWVLAIVVICAVAVFLANINGLSVSRTIATIGGVDVTEAEYKYYLEDAKAEILSNAGLQEATEGFWDTEIDGKKASELAKEKAKESIISVNTGVSKALEAGLALTDEEKATARSSVKGKTADEREQIKQIRETIGASEDVLAQIMEKSYLESKYYQYLSEQENSPLKVDDAQVAEKISTDYALVQHVLISNTKTDEVAQVDENGQPITSSEEDTAAYAEEAKKKAEDVLAKAVAGADFANLMKEYGEDPGMESSPEGYYINKDGYTVDGQSQMVPEFTAGTFAVAAGEVNPQLVESSYGWHIIKRCALPTEGENYEMIKSSAQSALVSELYDLHLASFADSISIEIKENLIAKIKIK